MQLHLPLIWSPWYFPVILFTLITSFSVLIRSTNWLTLEWSGFVYNTYIVDVTLSISVCHKEYKVRVFHSLGTFSFWTSIRHFNIMEKFNLYAQLYETENRFRRACQQIILLNSRLEELQLRYDQARLGNHKSFRYNLRLKMATVEGHLQFN